MALRRIIVSSLLAGALLTTSARAATSLFLHAEASHPGGGRQIAWTDADGTFVPSETSTPFEMLVTTDAGPAVLLRFAAPAGAPLAVGSYSGATNTGGVDALLDVSFDEIGCTSVGSFDVLELSTGLGGAVDAMAVDFALGCAGASTSLTGSLRYRSGDADCAAAVDGTPCNDLDPCTAGEVCRNDACGDGDAIACDDGDPCTTDACDPAVGCVSYPVMGTCWATRAVIRIAASASAAGRSARCSAKCEVPDEGALVLFDDGTYLVPGGQLTDCSGGTSVDVPDEIGVARPVRRRSVALEPANEAELFAAAAECIQEANPFDSYRARLTLARDGLTLRGRSTLRGRVAGRIPVRIKMSAKIRGAVVGGPEVPPVTRKPLPSCSEPIRLRCRTS